MEQTDYDIESLIRLRYTVTLFKKWKIKKQPVEPITIYSDAKYRAEKIITCVRLVMPSRKQIASRMLDLPLPFSPVIALNRGSNPLISVRWAYDLNPSMTMDLMNMIVVKKQSYCIKTMELCQIVIWSWMWRSNISTSALTCAVGNNSKMNRLHMLPLLSARNLHQRSFIGHQ